MKLPPAIDGDPDQRATGWRQILDTALMTLISIVVAGAVLALFAIVLSL